MNSWLSGFVALETHGANAWGQIAIESVHRDLPLDAATDMGIFEFETRPGADGIYFYGDCSKWGNFGGGSRMALWIRVFDDCRVAPAGGTVTAGRRWLTVKLLPSPTPHL